MAPIYTNFTIVLIIAIVLVISLYFGLGYVWGLIVSRIMKRKGYTDNWFYIGFFLQIIALIIAVSKPDLNQQPQINTVSTSSRSKDEEIIETIRSYKRLMDEGIITKEEFEKRKEKLLDN